MFFLGTCIWFGDSVLWKLFPQLLRHHLSNGGVCLLVPPQKEWQGLQQPSMFEGKRLVVSFHQNNLCARCHVCLRHQSRASCDSLSAGLPGVSSFGNSLQESEHPAGVLVWCCLSEGKEPDFYSPSPQSKFGILTLEFLESRNCIFTQTFSL